MARSGRPAAAGTSPSRAGRRAGLMPAGMMLAAALALGGCGMGAVSVVAPMSEVQARAYSHPGPASLSLYTVINNRSGSGAHTALLINGSQRALWDPAGSFYHPQAPERNDLVYGFTPTVQAVYEDYHARETFRIIRQDIEVPREVADRALALAAQAGPAGSATCSISTAGILRQLPGFGDFPSSYFPKASMEAFGARPGVRSTQITDDDADDNHGVLIRPTRPDGPDPSLERSN